MKQPLIYCIVVTYNGAAWVQQCFSSLHNSTVPVNVIAVDNASTDDTLTLLQYNFPGVFLIETGANLGFGKANNIGIRQALAANADYILLLNQDAWVQPGCIASLVGTLSENPLIGIVSPVHLNAAGDDLEAHFKGYVNTQDCPGFLTDAYFGRQQGSYTARFINAAAWMLPRQTVERVGGFDPLFPHYGEDDDYIERLHYAGLQLVVNSKAFVHHDAKGLTDTADKNARRLIIHHLVNLKKVSNTYRSNWLNFIKSEWDAQTTMLLFRRFKAFWWRARTGSGMFGYYNKIKKAREQSKKPGAFL